MTRHFRSSDRRWHRVPSKVQVGAVLFLLVLVLLPLQELLAQQQDKIAALKQSLGENKKSLRQYQWTETTSVSVKGEQKSQTQKVCRYGPDGKVQKQQISAPPQQSSPGGLKGRIVAKKKGEMADYMEEAAALIHQYVPPDPQRIQAAKESGNLAIKPMGGGVQLEIRNYLKPGDTLAITLAGNNIAQIHVGSYLDSQKDAITLDVSFASLNDGTSYPAKSVLVAPAKNIDVVVQNSGYQKVVAQVQQAPQQSQPGQSTQPTQAISPQAIDKLTAPIALYPDALIAQILTASTNHFECASFAGWLSKNSSLQGSAQQDAAQKAGFDACFVALAPFPQVVQMMAQQADWTKQLGEAFTTNRNAVFDSIQRLRAQAQAAGNLQSTPQQQVQTQTTSSGQQVIVIQPANPQVVYVPTYNPQTVYVQSSSTSTATAAAVGFTAGVIIGAAASNNYYYGPYAWHGAAMYNEAWDNRYDYAENRNDMYQQNASQRQSAAQSNQTQRQSAAQSNQTQRQSTATTAQGNAQSNQAARQSSASTYSRGSGDAATQRSGMSSGGFSGFQGGGQARAESSRGSRSLGGGGFSGGGGRASGGGGRRR